MDIIRVTPKPPELNAIELSVENFHTIKKHLRDYEIHAEVDAFSSQVSFTLIKNYRDKQGSTTSGEKLEGLEGDWLVIDEQGELKLVKRQDFHHGYMHVYGNDI